MPTINYHTLGGRIRAQADVLGRKVQYLHDALGSIVQTATNGNPASAWTLRFTPYGSVLLAGGGNTYPRFGWVGQQGYRRTDAIHSEQYVRARHYSTAAAAWLSRDALWPTFPAYAYARSSPTTVFDPMGLAPCCCCCAEVPELASVTAHYGGPYTLPSPCSDHFPSFTGMIYYVDYLWYAVASGEPATDWTACNLSQGEMRNTCFKVAEAPYQWWSPSAATCQALQMQSCATNVPLCLQSDCLEWDAPGMANTPKFITLSKNFQKDVILDICAKFTVSSSCQASVCDPSQDLILQFGYGVRYNGGNPIPYINLPRVVQTCSLQPNPLEDVFAQLNGCK